MSRRATLVSALSFVALILSRSMVAQQRDNSRPSDMATSIAVTTSSPSLDLVLISPQDPSFDGVTRTLLGVAASGPALDLKPFLAVLSNRSSGTVVAYEMFWNVTNTDKTGRIVRDCEIQLDLFRRCIQVIHSSPGTISFEAISNSNRLSCGQACS
jgi:hypothetical protein